MNELLQRINAVINTAAFERTLNQHDLDMIDFQSTWTSYGSFEKLPTAFKLAIRNGEEELYPSGADGMS